MDPDVYQGLLPGCRRLCAAVAETCRWVGEVISFPPSFVGTPYESLVSRPSRFWSPKAVPPTRQEMLNCTGTNEVYMPSQVTSLRWVGGNLKFITRRVVCSMSHIILLSPGHDLSMNFVPLIRHKKQTELTLGN